VIYQRSCCPSNLDSENFVLYGNKGTECHKKDLSLVASSGGEAFMSWARALSLSLLLVIDPSWASAQSKKLESIKIGYSGVGIAHDLLKIMGNKLIFEKHGLNAQSIYIGSGSLMNQAVVAGSIQFTTSDLPSQIQSALAGIDFKIISVTIDRLDGAIMARKGIRNPQELKGKK